MLTQEDIKELPNTKYNVNTLHVLQNMYSNVNKIASSSTAENMLSVLENKIGEDSYHVGPDGLVIKKNPMFQDIAVYKKQAEKITKSGVMNLIESLKDKYFPGMTLTAQGRTFEPANYER